MNHRRLRHRRRLIAVAVGSAGALAVALGVGLTSAMATGSSSATPAPSASSSATSAPWAPENDEKPLGHQKAAVQPRTLSADRKAASALQLKIPAPSGKYSVGMVGLHLVDKTRADPYVSGSTSRELMVSLWYPATSTSGHYKAPWMPSISGAHFLATRGLSPQLVTLPTTAGHVLAPVNTALGKLPVLLYSTGLHSDRATGTALVQDLASRGYLVVTVDHTHDANEVQFPGNRLEVNRMPAGTHSSDTLKVRAADIKFVINQLKTLSTGGNPDAGHATLPTGLTKSVDMTKIGMFGWSLGGGAVATSMQLDSRILAGANLDGQFFGTAQNKDLKRPFMLFSSGSHNRNNDSSWRNMWSHLKGYKVDIKLKGAAHLSFSDNEWMVTQEARLLGLSQAQLQQQYGTIDPTRAIAVQRVYLAAFFDQELRKKHSTLLDGASSKYPEISFVP
ncbi:Platelet-activating factor acetylhydrolase, isoform II [Streptomyces sp. 3213]|uniref:alpha/beta hydrolase family protein n=1 Tax=Streptomyces sp. 3213.3 TaxID=1855348 RepID=UPI00089AF45B|nr:hydrolase [Streptomyces sp. 3213.3]SED40753.1 Platelet-activating factor acetylhydrolase, isoform II [Streptomyces sp. 3213] [Streptomyces sp. 3213.3]